MLVRFFFTLLLILNAYLFATINDTARGDIAYQAKQIPSRIGEVIEVVGMAIQERANHNLEVSSL